MSYYLIKNARIIDGTGNPSYYADLEIKEDRISRIAPNLHNTQAQVFDAQGLCLSPGFIDVHTHDDIYVIKYPEALAKISQGITTVIVGNCGISASPATLSSAPPDPMNLLGEQADFCYPNFSDYVQAVIHAQPAVNVGALVGHTTLRNNVMPDLFQSAQADHITQMRKQLSQALDEGALGLSTGLAYASAFQASAQEIHALAQELVAKKGVYTTHLRSEFAEILPAMDEAFAVGQRHQVPVIISHLKCAGVANWGRTTQTLAKLDQAALTQEVGCDCYPYTASSSTLDLKQVTDEHPIFITWSTPFPEHAQNMLSDIAQTMGKSLLETAALLQPAGAVYYNMCDEDLERVLQSKHSVIGSDGLPNDPHPHPRLWGAFPRVLGLYCREKQLFSLETAIHKMTGKSAQRYQLLDRGVLKVGAFADLVLFDAQQINDTASFSTPKQAAQGIHQVLVNGKIAYTPAQTQIERHGRFLANSLSKTLY